MIRNDKIGTAASKQNIMSRAYIVLVKVFIRELGKKMVCLHNTPIPIGTLSGAQWESN
jgi:hypothetical protein